MRKNEKRRTQLDIKTTHKTKKSIIFKMHHIANKKKEEDRVPFLKENIKFAKIVVGNPTIRIYDLRTEKLLATIYFE